MDGRVMARCGLFVRVSRATTDANQVLTKSLTTGGKSRVSTRACARAAKPSWTTNNPTRTLVSR